MRSHGMRRLSPGSLHPTPFAPGCEASLTHQPSYPFARDVSSLVAQLNLNTRTAVSLLMILKDLSNVGGELSIFSSASTGRTLTPGVESAFGNAKHLAHHHNGKLVLVLFNKLILHFCSRDIRNMATVEIAF
jgi:hypothetical protein